MSQRVVIGVLAVARSIVGHFKRSTLAYHLLDEIRERLDRAGGGKIELVRPLTIMFEIATVYMPMREELLHSVQSAKHEHSRGVWGHAPTGNF